MLLLHNTVRAYAWGTIDGIAELVGSEPTGGPEAELWVGTHPGAPSVIAGDPGARTLAEVVAADPRRWLGARLADEGRTELPFLLKVLAIGRPLSLQAHPSDAQARMGYEREDAAGISLDAPTRTYRDTSAKPEALVALVPTSVLCGFRDPGEAAGLLERLTVGELSPLVELLQAGGPAALADALGWILRLGGEDRDVVATKAAAAAGGLGPDDPFGWVSRLAEDFPGDPACLAPLLLEVVELAPDQAVHLPAGNLHAYLHGAGIEIMASSDNVLRGGLTPKHVDVDELLRVLRFEPGVPPAPEQRAIAPAVRTFDAGEDEFALAVIEAGASPVAIEAVEPSLLLALGGEVGLAGPSGGVTVGHGDAVFVPPGEGPIEVTGTGQLWWATTGRGLPTAG